MQILSTQRPEFQKAWSEITRRHGFDKDIESQVAAILAGVATRGDAAIAEYAQKFDNVDLEPTQFALKPEEWQTAGRLVDPETKKAITTARDNLRTYAAQHRPESWSFSPRQGVRAGENFHPLDRVGIYVPGGTAPLVSSVLHTVTLAEVAGVKDIAITTPCPKDGSLSPELLFAAATAGATEVYRLGGVYAIGAFAFGTPSVPRVQKIAGPGNAYVAAAKRQVYGHVALDLVAGPSEILIIADGNANPVFAAADMLSQAEHGSGMEKIVLLTDSEALIHNVREQINIQQQQLSRFQAVSSVLAQGTYLVQTRDLAEAIALANDYAPEHLAILTEDAAAVAENIRAAGAVFIGQWTPEPMGDFVAGPSHVLPTGGSAKFFNGLTVDSFMRRTSILSYDEKAFAQEAPLAARIAASEGLEAHGRSINIRF